MRQSRTRRSEYGGARIEHRLLSHIRDPHALLKLQRAVIGGLEAAQYLEQGRLAGAVAADQPDAFALLEREVSVIEQGDMAEGELSVEQGDKGHAVIIGTGLQEAAEQGFTGGRHAPAKKVEQVVGLSQKAGIESWARHKHGNVCSQRSPQELRCEKSRKALEVDGELKNTA